MFKIYTDSTFLTAENRRCVFPLLFDLWYTQNQKLLQVYELVAKMEEAEVVIVPIDIAEFYMNKQIAWLRDFIDAALAINKKVWVYSAGDYGLSITQPVYTFRLSGFDSKLSERTFIMPSFIADPIQYATSGGAPIPKAEKARIGFVGHASRSSAKWLKEWGGYILHNYKRFTKKLYTDYQGFYPSSIKRFDYLLELARNEKLSTDFVYRDQYRAGVKTDEEKERTTRDFFLNIDNNPYTFCLRGAGNYSVRFYETLAMGRIPVLVNTDCRLPLTDYINWKNHCVLIDDQNPSEALIDFHQKITPQQFEDMQRNNRELWLNYLSRESYFTQIATLFKDMK